MNRRTSEKPIRTASARKVATALLLTAMFLVPLIPVGTAANPVNFAIGTVSGNTPATSSHYNFTFKASGDEQALNFSFPTGFDVSSAALVVGHNNTGGTNEAIVQTASYFNVTDVNTLVASTEYYLNVTGIVTPREAKAYTITMNTFNATNANGTVQATLTVSPYTVSFDVQDDAGGVDFIRGSGATSDYAFNVTRGSWMQGGSLTPHDGDFFNVTFPTGYDLTSATVVGGGAITGQSVGFNITTSDLAQNLGVNFTKVVKGVKNPTVTATTTQTLDAVVRSSTYKTVGTGTDSTSIFPTAVVFNGKLDVTEGTKNDTVEVTLKSKPSDTVTVTFDGNGEVEFNKATMTFTTGNWSTAQTLKVIPIDDSDVEGTVVGEIDGTTASDDGNYNGVTSTHPVTIVDNDVGIVLRENKKYTAPSGLEVTEGDTTTGVIYDVALSTAPTKTVTITVAPDSDLKVDKTTLTFTTGNWATVQEVKVLSNRADDDQYTDPDKLNIAHTSKSDDATYNDLSADLDVTLVDDEHVALGLTDEQIREANELVKLTLTEKDTGIELDWELPDGDELEDIFDTDDIDVKGVQILYANSPYILAKTFDTSDDEFDDHLWLHLFTADATSRTKYLVTMYYNEDVGKWSSSDLPDTRDDGYGGEALKDPLLPWWAWLLIAIGGVVLIGLILLAVVAAQNRSTYGKVDWDDDLEDADAPAKKEKKQEKPKAADHDLECPVCDHQFSVKGIKPIKTECPNCGAKGTLS